MYPLPKPLKTKKEGKINRKAKWKPSQVENTVAVVKETDTVFLSIVSVL